MGAICQRSPCDTFMSALGRYIFGRPSEAPDHYVMQVHSEKSNSLIEITVEYCPFCGTRLSGELDESYLKVKKIKLRKI